VAAKLGIDLIWFGVLLGVNMQTSFMHPPFGFALFYLRSVAPAKDYLDKVSGKLTPKVTTGQIYWGAAPFVVIQLIMVGLIIAFPGLVTGGLGKAKVFDTDAMRIEVPAEVPEQGEPNKDGGTAGQPDTDGQRAIDDDDPARAIERLDAKGRVRKPGEDPQLSAQRFNDAPKRAELHVVLPFELGEARLFDPQRLGQFPLTLSGKSANFAQQKLG